MESADALHNSKQGVRSAERLAADPLALGIAFALLLTVGQRAIGFVRGILFCRFMSDDQLGQWSVVWSLLLLLAPLAALGLPGSFCRYSEHYLQRGQLRAYLRRVTTVSGVATGLLAVGMLIAPRTFAHWIFREADQVALVHAIAGALVVVAVFNAVQSLMESLRQIRVVSWMRFVQGLSFAVVAPALLLAGPHGTLAVIIGLGISCLVGLLPSFDFFRKSGGFLWDREEPLSHGAMWARIAPFAAWTWVSNLLSNSYESVDRFMLLHLSQGTPADAQGALGQYHSSLIIPQLLLGVATVISGIVLPYLSAHWERNERQSARQLLHWTLKALGVAFLVANVLVLIAAPGLFDWVLQGRYRTGMEIMPLTMVYCYWLALITVAQMALWCSERVGLVAVAMGLGLAANVALNAALIPAWGLTGAVLATSAANVVSLATLLGINHRLGWRVDRGLVLVCALPLVLLLGPTRALVCALLLGYAIARYEWVFSEAEKRQLDQVSQAIRSRVFGRANAENAFVR